MSFDARSPGAVPPAVSLLTVFLLASGFLPSGAQASAGDLLQDDEPQQTEEPKKLEPMSAHGAAGGQEPASSLPQGHPPLAPRSMPAGHPQLPGDAIPPVPEGAGTGAEALVWKTPEGWVEETPSSSMRRAQYRVPGEGGDGECVVFYFGPGQGGDPLANAERWAGQFVLPDGRPGTEDYRLDTLELDDVKVTLVEVAGTYSGGMAIGGRLPQVLESAMLLGAIAEGPDSNWFFKFTGPEKTVTAEKDAFLTLVRSLRAGG